MAELSHTNKLFLFNFPSHIPKSRKLSPLTRTINFSSLIPKLSSSPNNLLLISTSVKSDGSLVFKFGDASEIPHVVEDADGSETLLDDAEIEVELESGSDGSLVANVEGSYISSVESDVVEDDLEVKSAEIEVPNGKESVKELVVGCVQDERSNRDLVVASEVVDSSEVDVITESGFDVGDLDGEAELEEEDIDDEESVKDEQNNHDLAVASEVEGFSVGDSKVDVIIESGFDIGNSDGKAELEEEVIVDEKSVEDEQNNYDLDVASEVEDSIVEGSEADVITETGFDVGNLDSKAELEEEDIGDEEIVKDEQNNNDLVVASKVEDSSAEGSEADVITESDFEVGNLDSEVALEDEELEVELGLENDGTVAFNENGHSFSEVENDVGDDTEAKDSPVDVPMSNDISKELVESVKGEDSKVNVITASGFDDGNLDSEVEFEDEAIDDEVSGKDDMIKHNVDEALDEEVIDPGLPSIAGIEDSPTGDFADTDFPSLVSVATSETIVDREEISSHSGDILTLPLSVSSTSESVSHPLKVNDAADPSTQQSDDNLCKDVYVAADQGMGIPLTEDINVREQISAPPLCVVSAAASITHPTEALAGGDDAYFVSDDWFGVADGVGQWSFGGIEKGEYAQEFIQNCERLAKKSLNTGLNSLKELLERSASMTESSGAARVLIAHIADRVLHVANIGDSGFVIVRNGTVFKKSSPMFHEFNFPCAISSGDNPVEAVEVYNVELEDGDIIVTATDGLFDNLYELEIASLVSKAVEDGKNEKEIAELLASRSQEVGKSPYARTPFAEAVQAAGHDEFSGGKFDHVTVIVSAVRKE